MEICVAYLPRDRGRVCNWADDQWAIHRLSQIALAIYYLVDFRQRQFSRVSLQRDINIHFDGVLLERFKGLYRDATVTENLRMRHVEESDDH